MLGNLGHPKPFIHTYFYPFYPQQHVCEACILASKIQTYHSASRPRSYRGRSCCEAIPGPRPIVVAKACRVANGSVAFETQKHLWCDFQLRNIFRYIGDYLHLLGTACLAMFLLSQFWKVVVLCIPQQLLSSSVAVSASAVLGGHATSRWQTFMSFLAVHKY